VCDSEEKQEKGDDEIKSEGGIKKKERKSIYSTTGMN
jgi:hypothetical protein